MAIKRTIHAPTPQTRPGAKSRTNRAAQSIPGASYANNPMGETANNKGVRGKTRKLGNRR